MDHRTIDNTKLETLNALKEQQAQIEKEIKDQEEIARNESKKQEGRDSANKYLLNDVEERRKKNLNINRYFQELVAENSEVKLITTSERFARTPSCYLYDPNEKYNQLSWKGEPIISEKQDSLEIKYKGHRIAIEHRSTKNSYRGEYKMTLDWNIDDGDRAYKRAKTVIEKIDQYERTKAYTAKYTSDLKTATVNAIKHLQTTIPTDAEIVESTKSYFHGYGRNRKWSEYPVIIITFKNGNSVIYKPTHDETETFKITLESFKDTRLDSIKTDPVEMIKYLK